MAVGVKVTHSILDAEIINQMQNIYQSLKDGDPVAARRLMKDHVQFFIDKVKIQLF